MKTHEKTKFRFAIALMILAIFSVQVSAQTASPSPTPSEEELKLQKEKALLELQRDIELAKKAIRDAQPQPAAAPSPTTTALAGDTTLTDVRLETDIVAYKAMSEAAQIIGQELKTRIEAKLPAPITEKTIRTIAIYDSQIVKDWRFYQALAPAFDGQVQVLLKEYGKHLCALPDVKNKEAFCSKDDKARDVSADKSVPQLIGNTIPTAFAAGTNLLKSFVDLVALFRTDTKIEGKALTVDESALVAELFRSLKNEYGASQVNLYYPEVFPPRINPTSDSPTEQKYSSTITTIGALFLAKIEADKLLDKLAKEKGEITEGIKPTLETRAKLKEKLDQVVNLLTQLQNLKDALDAEDDPTTKKRIEKEIARTKTTLATLTPKTVLEQRIKSIDDDPGLKAKKARLKEIGEKTDALTELNKDFKNFVDQFVKVDANGVNALALFIRAEDIQNAMKGNSFWLEIKSVTAGGNNRTRKNFFRYFTGAKLDHSGGVVVEYALYDMTGAVVYSDKLSYYQGYVEPKVIRNRTKFKDPIQ